jgi:HEAT repeat protein
MLGRIAPIAKAVPLLVSVLEAENLDVARSAVKTLGEIGPEARIAVPALLLVAKRPGAPYDRAGSIEQD